jgi:hypothetical protein
MGKGGWRSEALASVIRLQVLDSAMWRLAFSAKFPEN